MSILDNLLGGSGSTSTDIDVAVAAHPEVGLQASEVLGVSTDGGGFVPGVELTGIGDVGVGVSAPVMIGVSASNDTAAEVDDGGGLLSGLL